MIQLLIFACCNNTILSVFYKWNIIQLYEIHKRKWHPNWCELCFFFWLGMIENTYFNLYCNISYYLCGYVLINAFAVCFLSQGLRLIQNILKSLYENSKGRKD